MTRPPWLKNVVLLSRNHIVTSADRSLIRIRKFEPQGKVLEQECYLKHGNSLRLGSQSYVQVEKNKSSIVTLASSSRCGFHRFPSPVGNWRCRGLVGNDQLRPMTLEVWTDGVWGWMKLWTQPKSKTVRSITNVPS